MKHNWTLEELQNIYDTPLLELISKASLIHSEFHDRNEVQVCSLISVKTGGCPEDCKYCAQSSRNPTTVKAEAMMTHEEVISMAKKAMEQGASRICLGAAWREIRNGKPFDQILQMVRSLNEMGVEVCTTLGMLTDDQAKQLADAGLYAYNHNLDTSRRYYPEITTTRTYDDRLNTLDKVEKAGITTCCGGILGMGETIEDRLSLIQTLANRNSHPESVPINILKPIRGAPLQDAPPIIFWDFLRTVAVARIAMPKSMVRLSCGRDLLSMEQQALCFLAGANSIHMGEKLLTVSNTPVDKDQEMFALFGLTKRKSFAHVS